MSPEMFHDQPMTIEQAAQDYLSQDTRALQSELEERAIDVMDKRIAHEMQLIDDINDRRQSGESFPEDTDNLRIHRNELTDLLADRLKSRLEVDTNPEQ